MKKPYFFLIVASLALSSCQSDNQKEAITDIASAPVEEVVLKTDGPAKTVAHLSIEGMGCEMACGSAIKKALSEIDGVKLAEIDFDAERETDFAIVEFDASVANTDQMVNAVNALRKGHYKVSALKLERHEPVSENASGEPQVGRENSKSDARIDTRTITFPNILDILNKLY
jgi:copper chaperone CopZ